MAGSSGGGDWFTLDNAAKIYPSTASKESPAEFRLGFTLRRPVRLLYLQRAVERVMPRFPYFQVTLHRGFFWYYLQRTSALPQIELLQNVPDTVLSISDRNSPLLRISAGGRTVAVDFSHIITDGSGGTRFLLTLAAEYLRQCGHFIPDHPAIMDPDESPSPEEAEDGHRRSFAGSSVHPEELGSAYHIANRPFKRRRYRALRGLMPAQKVLQLAKEHGVTLTEYLTALYIYSLARVYRREQSEGRKQRRSTIRLEVPVDMRRYYPSRTMRNFSLYISPEVDMALGEYRFEELLAHVHHSIRLLRSEKQLGRQISRNVGSELSPFVRFVPLFVKDMVLSAVHARLGEAIHSGVLSNLGRVEAPAELTEQLSEFHFDLNPDRVMKKACAVLSCGETLRICFTSAVESREVERYFFTHLTARGVPVSLKEY
jgi:hypothetical protein